MHLEEKAAEGGVDGVLRALGSRTRQLVCYLNDIDVTEVATLQ